MQCRSCERELEHMVVDLGMSPLCESYLTAAQLNHMEPFYPLRLFVCAECFLVQLDEFASPRHIFSEYAYFSSYSDTWLRHARQYTEMARQRFGVDTSSLVVELASNDGYLLQYFVEQHVPVLGVEPAANVARAAEARNVPTRVEFFGASLATRLRREGYAADLVVANNVLAQVPGLNDFVAGIALLLKQTGVVTLEFPHLLRVIGSTQFDTIYHEHFSYFCFTVVDRVFRIHGLTLFDVEELPTHGGSLRVFGKHQDNEAYPVANRVHQMRTREENEGMLSLSYYEGFAARVEATKRQLLSFLIEAKRERKSVVGYGAPGKGNTLLNYCGIRSDFLDYTVDRAPYKQGKYLPGTHIPIFHPDRIRETRPDFVLILPWNLRDEIIQQLGYAREWGARFVVPIPSLSVIP